MSKSIIGNSYMTCALNQGRFITPRVLFAKEPARFSKRCPRYTKCQASVSSDKKQQRPVYIPNKISDPDYVRIFDTTLRDGEQSPGATLTSTEKLAIAYQLSKLGVDIIEAGFPVASTDDFNAVKRIADEVGNKASATEPGYYPVICGLSRTRMKDIEIAWDAVKNARYPRVHTFIATSEIHMKHKLKMTPDEVVKTALKAVDRLRELGCEDIEFSPEDAGRSDPVFLYRILSEVIKAGATTLNIPDTTGWNLPHEFGGLIKMIKENTKGVNDVVISTHCQNDLGLSTANSLSGAMNGARQIECTINGIGERAGNASLEEVVMAIKLKGPDQMNGLWTGVNPIHIAPTSKMVMDYSGMPVQPHKAIVGANAFAHESGIHQDGMLKSRDTYEIMSPESIGLHREDQAGIVLGKHSGRHALKTRLQELGYELDEEKLNEMFKRFKSVAELKKGFADEDLLAIIGDQLHQPTAIWKLKDLQVVCGTMGLPTATVRMIGPDNVVRVATACGNGPVDATYKAINKIVGVRVELMDYSISNVTQGIEALAHTRVIIKPVNDTEGRGYIKRVQGGMSQRNFSGSGADGDVVTSSARAYVSALNKTISYLGSITEQDVSIDSSSSVEEINAVGVNAV